MYVVEKYDEVSVQILVQLIQGGITCLPLSCTYRAIDKKEVNFPFTQCGSVEIYVIPSKFPAIYQHIG